MQFGSVTFVLVEAILRELSAEVTHHPVTRDLRDYARGSDAQADAITVDDRCLWNWKRNHREAVDQNVIRCEHQRFIGQAHGPMAGTQDIDPVNLYGIDNANPPVELAV
jgi:hypothetical protein